MGIIIYNNISSEDFGIRVEHYPHYEIPEKEYEVIHVPGRNGDVILDNNTFKNSSRNYQISVPTFNCVRETSFYQTINRIAEWLHSASGYTRLEDSYEPLYYRQAVYRESNIIQNLFNNAGRTVLTFDCKPQRFLKSGEKQVFFDSEGHLINPTNFASLPVIQLEISRNTTGTVHIGDYSFSIKAQTSGDYETYYLTVDCELQDVYGLSKLYNKNSEIILSDNNFPQLKPGDNSVWFTGGITSLQITPNWWTI